METFPIISIPIHSFVDLITNSSSETFIEPSQETLESFKKLTAVLLVACGIENKDVDEFVKFDYNVTFEVQDQDTCKSKEIKMSLKEYQDFDKYDYLENENAYMSCPPNFELVLTWKKAAKQENKDKIRLFVNALKELVSSHKSTTWSSEY